MAKPSTNKAEKSPLERAIDIITIWLYGAIPNAGESSIAVDALKRLGAFYGQILSRLDHTKSVQLPSNRAMALVANRGLKCTKIECAGYFKGDSTRYNVVLSENAMPTIGHNYAGGNASENNKLVQSSTPESLLGDYTRGLSDNSPFDNRETLFVICYLFDQILSGLAWSGESAVKSAGLRLLLNSIDRIRVVMTWKGKNEDYTLIYSLDDMINRCQSYYPNWVDAFSVSFAGIATTKSATVKVDASIKAELKSEVFADF